MSRRGGESDRCDIMLWINNKDPDFYNVLVSLGAEIPLSGRGAIRGATFLYPNDKALRDEIISLYEENKAQAEKMVYSLIIPIAITNHADFKTEVIGNMLGIKYNVMRSNDATHIKLDNGAVLTRDVNFCEESEQGGFRTAIWYFDGDINRLMVGDKFEIPVVATGGKKKKAKKYVRGGGEGLQIERCNLAQRVLKLSNEQRGSGCDIYMSCVVSIMNYLKATNKQLYYNIIPILDYEPFISFHLLVEPYKTRSDYLIQVSEMFTTGIEWENVCGFKDAPAEYLAFFDDIDQSSDCKFYKDRREVFAKIDIARYKTCGAPQSSRVGFMETYYRDLETKNTIEGYGPIYPSDTLAMVKGGKKRWQDDFRAWVSIIYNEISTYPILEERKIAMNDLCTKICHAMPGDNYVAELKTMTSETNLVDMQSEYTALIKFVGSSDFLFVPPTSSDAAVKWGSPRPDDYDTYNRNAVGIELINRPTGMKNSGAISSSTKASLKIASLDNPRIAEIINQI